MACSCKIFDINLIFINNLSLRVDLTGSREVHFIFCAYIYVYTVEDIIDASTIFKTAIDLFQINEMSFSIVSMLLQSLKCS